MSRNNEQVAQDLMKVMREEQVKTARMPDELHEYVVADTAHYTPMRRNGEGKIALQGGAIYSTKSYEDAAKVAASINAMAEAKSAHMRVMVMSVSSWKRARHAAIEQLISVMSSTFVW